MNNQAIAVGARVFDTVVQRIYGTLTTGTVVAVYPATSDSAQSYADVLWDGDENPENLVRLDELGVQHNAVVVRRTDNHHGYPYRAQCPCGYVSQSYAAPHAAQPFADIHNNENEE
jgi:hypothetical protein